MKNSARVARSESAVSFRVALCYPATDAVTVMPPLGIGYLASAAEAAGFPTDVFDLARRRRPADLSAGLARTLAGEGHRVIGISVSTPNYESARRLAADIRAARPDAVLVIGGPHPSALIERSLREFPVDYVLPREAERTFAAFLRAIDAGTDPAGTVAGVFALRDGRLAGTPSTEVVDPLDDLPWPAWDKLQPQAYPPMPHQFFVRRLPVAPILTSRGCPMGCSFCATSYLFGRAIRVRSAADVVAEMTHLRDRFGIREIHFEDDNPTLARDHAPALFDAIAAAGLGLTLKCPNGLMTATLDAGLLARMRRAGVYQISLGIETTTEQALDRERKYLAYADVRRVVALAKRAGIDVQGLFVVGLPYDAPDGYRSTVRDAIRMGLDLAHFGVFIPLPGSESGELLAGCDLKTINFFTPFAGTPHVTPERLKKMQRWAVLRFYLRPRPILKLLSMLKPRQVAGALNIVRRYVLGF